MSTRRREEGDQSLLSRYCRRSQLTQGFFVYFLGDIFLWQSEVCCSLFFGPPTQGDEDDLLFDSSFKTKEENAKSLFNSNSVMMKTLASKFIRYDDNVI